jgi:hypothetical protein
MPITSYGYVVNSTASGWTQKGTASADLKDKHGNHAERAVWGKLPTSTPYFFVQDAFPCAECHAYFLAEALAGSSIIFKVTANNGSYSADHGLGMKTSTPCMIYYHAGTARYDSLGQRMAGGAAALGPHTAFPAHPDCTNY